MIQNIKLGWPAVVLASVALASLALVMTFAPDDTRTVVIEWLGWAFLAVSQFTGPIIRKHANKEEGTREHD